MTNFILKHRFKIILAAFIGSFVFHLALIIYDHHYKALAYTAIGNTNNPKQIVFLLHGLGGNASDMVLYAESLKADLPDGLFILPQAPLELKDSAGRKIRAWYDPNTIREGRINLQPSKHVLKRFIEEQHKIYETQDVILIGWSQGGTMALYIAPRLSVTVTGVVSMSGRLSDPYLSEKYKKFPIYMLHKKYDPVVTLDAHNHLKDAYQAAGFLVDEKLVDGHEHWLNMNLFLEIKPFIARLSH